MLRVLRRVGIAIGSLVAAWLVMSLVGGFLLPFAGSDGVGQRDRRARHCDSRRSDLPGHHSAGAAGKLTVGYR